MRGITGVQPKFRFRRLAALIVVATISTALSGCGGGGGTPGQSPTHFTLSAASASFNAVQGGTAPAAQSVTISVTGDTSAAINAAAAAGMTLPSWLTVNVNGSGASRTLMLTAAPAGVSVGQATAALVISATDAMGTVQQQMDFSVSLAVIAPPALTVSPATMTLGGPDGLAALAPVPLQITLASGQQAFPFTVALATDSGGQWLTVDSSSGSVAASGTTVNIGIDASQVRGGSYTGHVKVTATVYGTPVSKAVSVQLNREANRLVVTAMGVGFSQVGGRSVLTRTVQVLSNLGLTDVAWTASSDSPWLGVTASGTTGGNLVLTANPAGVPQGQTQFAIVTIKSADPTVENQQSIRAGLYLSSTAPVATPVAVAATNLAASPVEPIVAANAGGTSVSIYSVYSSSLLRTLAGVAAAAGPLVFSEDGQSLFVFDTTNNVVNQVDAQSGAAIANYNAVPLPNPVTSGGPAIAVMHPAGYAMLVTAAGRAFDLASGTQFQDNTFMWSSEPFGFSSSPDQSMVASQTGIAHRIIRSALHGGTLVTQSDVVTPPSGTVQNPSNGQSCFGITGDRIYTASGAPYSFPATSVATSQVIQTLPATSYPDSIQCVWNGLVVGGIDGYYNPNDVYVYVAATGFLAAELSSSGPSTSNRDLASRGLAVSADGTMLVSAWTGTPGVSGLYFQPLPAPP